MTQAIPKVVGLHHQGNATPANLNIDVPRAGVNLLCGDGGSSRACRREIPAPNAAASGKTAASAGTSIDREGWSPDVYPVADKRPPCGNAAFGWVSRGRAEAIVMATDLGLPAPNRYYGPGLLPDSWMIMGCPAYRIVGCGTVIS